MFVLGAALTLLTAYAAGALVARKVALPNVIRFGLGAAVLGVLVYFFFLFGAGRFLPVIFILIPIPFFLRSAPFSEPPVKPVDRPTRRLLLPLFAAFALYYSVHALAPEIQPDAISYHLGLVAEDLRLGGFPNRVGFYEVLPQGLEMLFALAYSIGGASAAKLVHFAFLLATIPLIVLTARRLKLSDAQAYAAAALYFFTPVVGLGGTCAYNDAALVFFTLATFYLLLIQQEACAGIAAGFCYAIKLTGLVAPFLALLYVLAVRRKLRPAFRLALGSLVMIAPWMLRAFFLTRNPIAPLLNSLFPNLYFNPVTERALAHSLTSYPGFHWSGALWAWAFTGVVQGVVGPLILAAPLAILALRKPAGRLLLAAAVALLVPVALNQGTRFLMPSLPFLSLALALALPRPALLALTCLQAALCFPPVVVHLEQPQAWALQGFPWRAALRLQSESDYLQSTTADYGIAKFVESHTTPQDNILALNGLSISFIARPVLEYWHSNRALRYTAALQTALARPATVHVLAQWPPQTLTGIRFRSTAEADAEWTVFETRLYSPAGFIYNSPQWTLSASTNLSDAPMAFDGNRSTGWTTRTPQRRGMFLEADFNHPQLLDSAQLWIAANAPQPGFVVEGRMANGRDWRVLSDRPMANVLPALDLRREATQALRLAGFTALTVYSNGDGLGAIGADMVKSPQRWNLRDLGAIGEFHVMKIADP